MSLAGSLVISMLHSRDLERFPLAADELAAAQAKEGCHVATWGP